METVSQSLQRLLVIPRLTRTRGWPFVLSWGHRLSGIILCIYIVFHVYTLLLLKHPDVYDTQMAIYRSFPFNLLAWLLAFPVIFHALNGGRLILYESFGNRNDDLMIRWVLALKSAFLRSWGVG